MRAAVEYDPYLKLIINCFCESCDILVDEYLDHYTQMTSEEIYEQCEDRYDQEVL
jgi:hypothetical protein